MAAAESLLYKKRKTTHKHVPVVNKVPGTWLPRTYQDKSIGLPCTSTGNDIVLTSPQNNDQYQVHYFLLSWIIARPHKNSTPSVPGTRYQVLCLCAYKTKCRAIRQQQGFCNEGHMQA